MGFYFFSCLALLCLTMSMFHLVWLIFIVVLFCTLLKNYKTKIILSALIPLLLVGGWYTKNLVLFNHFTSSTWFGMNISRVILPTPFQIPQDTIDNIANVGPFKCINKYQQWLPVNYNIPAIKSLQEIHKSSGFCNYNNIEYIPLSEKFQQASIAFFKSNPTIYYRNVITSDILYFAPASNYFYLTNNREKLGLYDKLLNLDVTPVYKSYIGLDNFILITLYAFIFFYVIKILRKNYKEKQVSKTDWKWQDITVIFAACNILFFIAIGNFLELGESNRLRFQVIPSLLIMFVYAYYNFKLQKPVKLIN